MFGYYTQRPQTPPVTKNLIIVNILFFLACMANESLMTRGFALFFPGSRYFHVWQYVTYMFMHGGFWHIFFNMYALYIFGGVTERIIGSRKFFVFYMLCGLGAALLHTGMQYAQAGILLDKIADGSQKALTAYQQLKMTPTVGASGAVYGILIAYAMLFPDNKLTLIFPPISLSAKVWVLIFAGIELLTGITGTAEGIAHFAHLGGMLCGWILVKIWRQRNVLFDKDIWI